MLFTVHTSYRALDPQVGYVRNFCQTDKVDFPDKDAAKAYCWERIFDKCQGDCSLISQSARASRRKGQ